MTSGEQQSNGNFSRNDFSSHSFFATQMYADFAEIKVHQISKVARYGDEKTMYAPRIIGRQDGETFFSPYRATFGGFSGLGRTSVLEDITDLLRDLKEKKGVMRCQIKLAPMHLDRQFANAQLEALILLGGEINYQDLNFQIDTYSWTEESLSKGNRKKLRQCRTEDFIVRPLLASEIKDLHDLLRINRASLGAQISISYERLVESVIRFGSTYKLYGVFAGNVLIAGAITVLALNESLYVYMWADNPDWRNFSPIVILFDHLVFFAQRSGVKYLDLGTASIEGVSMDGLVRFKKNLGAFVSDKPVVSIGLGEI